MIDIESWVYTQIVTALRVDYPNISTSSDPSIKPAAFPHVVIEQQDSSTVTAWRTTNVDNLVRVMFQVDVYSDAHGTRKSECKAIMAVVCDWMNEHNFTRISLLPVNFNDTIYRLTGRFTANVDMKLVPGLNNSTDNEYMLYQN